MARKKTSTAHRKRTQAKNRWPWYALGAVLLIIAIAAVWVWRSGQDSSEAGNTAEIALGEQVYATQCAVCHGLDLSGEANWQLPKEDGTLRAPPHDETGHTWHHDDAYLIESIRLGGARLPAEFGISAMPAYDDVLSEQEMAAVLAYIKSTWPPDIRDMQAGRRPN